MKTYKTQAEVDADIKNNILKIEDSVTFECSIEIKARIVARNINAWDINAWNINAWNIKAGDIKAGDINAWDINARNINAWDINARDISFYAVACAYSNLICRSIVGRREKSKYFTLDGEVKIG